MDLNQLEMFVATVEAGGVQRAAERVYRTQPALSMALRKLEGEIGAPLFDRSTRPPYVLTPTGELLYASAKRILRSRDETLSDLRDLHELRRGKLRIGANESAITYLLHRFVAPFHRANPNVKLELSRHNSASLVEAVKGHEVDVAFIGFVPDSKEIEALPVVRDKLIMIAHPSHDLLKKAEVHIRDLGKQSFLAHSVTVPSRQKVIEAFQKAETPLNISMEVSTLETIKKLVAMNLGIAFVPEICAVEELARGELAEVRIDDFKYERTLWMARLRSDAHSHAAVAFAQVVADGAAKLSQLPHSPTFQGPPYS